MDIPNLNAFVSVANSHSFSQAAESLHLTQPAVSKRISSLEEEIGTPLFDRIGRQIQLTEAGNALLPRALSILFAVEDAHRELSNLAGHVSGSLKLATSHHIGLHRLPDVLSRFHHNYPDVDLALDFMDSEQACAQVRNGSVELAIVTLPNNPDDSLETIKVWDDPLSIVVSPNHKLAQNKRTTVDCLSRYAAILPSEQTVTRQIIDQRFAECDCVLNTNMETNYLETIKMLVGIGLGWSILPDSMKGDKLITVPVNGLQLRRNLGIVLHPKRTRSNAASALVNLCSQQPA